jgi:hypothetical protein
MSSHRSLFESVTFFPTTDQPHTLMGDDTTTIPITGYGIMSFKLHGKSIRIPGYYVPLLGATLLSVKQHIQYEGCMFHASPKVTTMTEEMLLQSIGYRKLPGFKKFLKSSSNNTFRIQQDRNPTITPGQTATMNSSRRNTTPLPIPQHVGDVWHLDIGYGPKTAIGGIKYTLLAVDRHSRYKLVYGLKNLRGSLLQAMKMFLRDCGLNPKLLRTDFDRKIMGGEVAKHLLDQNIPIQSSPPYRQHQNGLVERQETG